MKSKLNFFRSLALAVAGLLCFSNAMAADNLSGMVGDVSGDGRISITDVATIIDAILSDGPVNAINDADGDGHLSINDITTLIDQLLDINQTTQRFVANGVPFTMVIVREGSFVMGTNNQMSDANYDEFPAHQVTLSTYTIGQTQVTQELWEAVMGNNPSGCRIHPQCPVENVSWNDCQEFISVLNALTGCSFRLPTEAEWEFAARGGNESHGYKYAGSNDLSSVGWYSYNDSWVLRGNGAHGTHEVATRLPNELNLYDMSGNVHEWCQDWYASYSAAAQTDPTGPDYGSNRVYRGGNWYFDEWFCRVSFRNSVVPTYQSHGIGMRLAL